MGFHGTDFFLGDRSFFSAVDRSFAVSSQVAALAKKRVGVEAQLIPNPADLDFFAPDNQSSPKPDAPFRLVSSGRLVGWKGFSVLIEALRGLDDKRRAFTCTIAGDGPEKENLEQQIESAGLKGKVKLVGRLDQKALRQLLSESDAYVAPSIGMEAFSIASLEGAASGLPLLLSDRVGLADFLDAADFISYAHNDEEALRRGIQMLMDRQKDAAWSNRKARHDRMQAQFSPKMIAQKIVGLIQSV